MSGHDIFLFVLWMLAAFACGGLVESCDARPGENRAATEDAEVRVIVELHGSRREDVAEAIASAPNARVLRLALSRLIERGEVVLAGEHVHTQGSLLRMQGPAVGKTWPWWLGGEDAR